MNAFFVFSIRIFFAYRLHESNVHEPRFLHKKRKFHQTNTKQGGAPPLPCVHQPTPSVFSTEITSPSLLLISTCHTGPSPAHNSTS